MTLFVANNLGVLAYNGSDWEVHAFKNGKKQRSLAFDQNSNRLYIRSQGEFGYFEGDWNYVSLLDLIPTALRDFDEMWDVYLYQSFVYFCTFQNIYVYVYDGSAITAITHPNGFDRTFHVNGKLFTQSHRGKLLEIKDHHLVPAPEQNQTEQIIAGVVDQDNGYLIFYNSGQIEFSSSAEPSKQHDGLIDALQGIRLLISLGVKI